MSSCQEWYIADINHDGTSGTVDLFSKYAIGGISLVNGNSGYTTAEKEMNFGYDSGNYYYSSYVRTRLNNEVYAGFTSSVQNAIKSQNFPSNGNTLSDKVKCPSVSELGLRGDGIAEHTREEGTIYPIFGTQQKTPNELAIRGSSNGAVSCWTRSQMINTSYYMHVGIVDSTGCCAFIGYGSSAYTIACIRF